MSASPRATKWLPKWLGYEPRLKGEVGGGGERERGLGGLPRS